MSWAVMLFLTSVSTYTAKRSSSAHSLRAFQVGLRQPVVRNRVGLRQPVERNSQVSAAYFEEQSGFGSLLRGTESDFGSLLRGTELGVSAACCEE